MSPNVAIRLGNYDFLAGGLCDHAIGVTHHHLAAVLCYAAFHARTHQRGLGPEERHRLPLHVGAHQRPVGVVMLQERDQRRGDADKLHGRDVHVVHLVGRLHAHNLALAGLHLFVGKLAYLVNRRVCLCDIHLLLRVRGKVNDFVGVIRNVRING